jgi:hypothetical protein
MPHEFTYEYDEDKDDVHVYDHNGTELQNSPVGVNNGIEIPSDVIPIIADELKYECEKNGMSDRALDIVIVLADTNQLVEK